MSEALYTAKALSTGGGRDGRVATDDRILDLAVRPPKALGGSGEGTNPEQLVAAGWAACFNGALQLMMKNAGVEAIQPPEVRVEMTLNRAEGGFGLSAKIHAIVHGVDETQARKLVQQAHAFCPYSRAMRDGIDIDVTAEAE